MLKVCSATCSAGPVGNGSVTASPWPQQYLNTCMRTASVLWLHATLVFWAVMKVEPLSRAIKLFALPSALPSCSTCVLLLLRWIQIMVQLSQQGGTRRCRGRELLALSPLIGSLLVHLLTAGAPNSEEENVFLQPVNSSWNRLVSLNCNFNNYPFWSLSNTLRCACTDQRW